MAGEEIIPIRELSWLKRLHDMLDRRCRCQDLQARESGSEKRDAEEVVTMAMCDVESCETLGGNGSFDPGDKGVRLVS